MTHWIECDSYDEAALARLKAESPSLQALEQTGSRLLPHFDGFLLDLFALLFKMNILYVSSDTVAPSAGFYRFLLTHIAASPALDIIRQQTVLDESAAGLATLLLGERLLAMLKTEKVITRGDMLDYWNLRQHEAEIERRASESETARRLEQQAAGKPAGRHFANLRGRMQREVELGTRHIERQAKQARRTLEEGAEQHRARVEQQMYQTLRDLEQVREDAESWSIYLGGGHRSSPGAQIELGSRLARNQKLKAMARLVGRMRETARALRRKLYERGNDEVYEVGIGAELSRLLPSELIGLRHPLLKRDFARRLLDRELLQYSLRILERKGRGPMIVCLDGSSSMEGEKEIWSKAVTLTLLDIARRQRRRFQSICFASTETPLQVLDIDTSHRNDKDMRPVFEIAEYFPGGGTDFQKPLSAALDCLRRHSHKRGDIVLITDGECRVDPDWLGRFKKEKETLGFSLFSVLIDVGSNSLGVLHELSDRVTSVTQLTSDASREVFLRVG